jgi:hypothetical protein
VGEWQHGWQFHASDSLERDAWNLLLQELALPSVRSNAVSSGKTRLRSCMGPFAAVWLTVCPSSDGLILPNWDLMFAMRRRLGIAVTYDGNDVHGHSCFGDNTGGRLNVRHNMVLAAWRQVFFEAGGAVPDRNVERLLCDTNVPVHPDDLRRLDIIVPNLNVERGLPIFGDVTVLAPLSANGEPRAGTSNQDGRLLELAETENNDTYREVIDSGLGSLQCLGCEVYGRWSTQSVAMVPALARERSRGVHPRLRRGIALSLQHRWWGLLGIAVQRATAHVVRNQLAGVDLAKTQLEPIPPLVADVAC